MKSQIKKAAAVALAMTMCVPGAAWAADERATLEEGTNSGSFETSFGVYSPALTVSVPLKADIRVNPLADGTSDKTVGRFTVASNSLDIINASVDVEADKAIPVNVTVNASISAKADDVMTEYSAFTGDNTSTKKKINLKLSKANTAATIALKQKADGTGSEDPAFVSNENKVLDLTKWEVNAAAEYDSAVSTPITQYGSLLSVDIGAPTTSDSTAGATFSTDAGKITAMVGSFAVTGEANTNADWQEDDIAVDITYNVKASKALSITTPTIATAPTMTEGTDTEATITVPSIGEATVVAVAIHNDGEGLYGDIVWEEGDYTVDYTTIASSAIIKIPADNEVIAALADDYSGKAQDLVVALSDGRFVVSTLTVTAAP